MPVAPGVRLISLSDQVKWLEKVLYAMQRANKPENEMALQEACIFTVKERWKAVEQL